MAVDSDFEIIAQQVSVLSARLEAIEARVGEIDKVVGRLEGAALTTARALQEISHHWDAVYDAMRRAEEGDWGQVRRERDAMDVSDRGS